MMLADVADGDRKIMKITKLVTKTGTMILENSKFPIIARDYEFQPENQKFLLG